MDFIHLDRSRAAYWQSEIDELADEGHARSASSAGLTQVAAGAHCYPRNIDEGVGNRRSSDDYGTSNGSRWPNAW